MKKRLSIFAAIAAGAALSSSSAIAQEMEKCKIVDSTGKGLIKAHKSDCAGSGHSCAGQNVAWDPEAWIMVPAGECEKINKGDLSGVAEEIKSKIEVDYLPKLTVEKLEAEDTKSVSSEAEDNMQKAEAENTAITTSEPEDNSLKTEDANSSAPESEDKSIEAQPEDANKSALTENANNEQNQS